MSCGLYFTPAQCNNSDCTIRGVRCTSPLSWNTVRNILHGILQPCISLCVSATTAQHYSTLFNHSNTCRMISSLLTGGAWPYRFMHKLSQPGLFTFFAISFLLYVAMYYIGKMLSHLRWGGKCVDHLLILIIDDFLTERLRQVKED